MPSRRPLTGIYQTCSRCGQEKDSSHFGESTLKCRGCRKAIWEENIRAQNLCPEEERIVRRDVYRKRKSSWVVNGQTYSVGHDEYWEAFVRQRGVCKICREPEKFCHPGKKTPKDLATDHCHLTGKFRGLLCQDCNLSIGKFKDDPLRLFRAAEYVLSGGEIDESNYPETEDKRSLAEIREYFARKFTGFGRWLHRDRESGRPRRKVDWPQHVSE